MADEGDAGDIFRKREEAFAISTYMSNREDLIKFYQELARMGNEKIPPEMKAEDESATSKALMECGKNLDEAVTYFCGNATKMSEDGASTAVARMCMAMFLLERLKKLREITLAMDDLGTFSLFITLRNRASESLSPAFFSRSSREMLGTWLDLEPLLTACSGLCGLGVPDLRDIMDEYQPRVVDAVNKKGK